MRLLSSKHGNEKFGNYRSTLISLINAYNYEKNMLLSVSNLVNFETCRLNSLCYKRSTQHLKYHVNTENMNQEDVKEDDVEEKDVKELELRMVPGGRLLNVQINTRLLIPRNRPMKYINVKNTYP